MPSHEEGRPGQGGLQDHDQIHEQDTAGGDNGASDGATPDRYADYFAMATTWTENDQDPAPPKGQRPDLAEHRRKSLYESGWTDEIIDGPLGIKDAPDDNGWCVNWTDGEEIPAGKHKGMAGFGLVMYDRDKRPDDGRKSAWPKGTTPYPACFRWVPAEDATGNVYVEGQRQAGAVASYAPAGVRVWCLPGSELSPKILDRLAKHAAGLPATVIPDGDWRRNHQVGSAVTERLPELLAQAGASEILIADVGGTGTDGADDIIGRTQDDQRAPLVAKILDGARPARDRRLELETERELIRLRARDQAQRLYVAETRGEPPGPHGTTLADLLAEPDDEAIYRVEGLWPTGGNVVFSAQRKAGKTTTRDNLIRCLADGGAFLGQGRRVALADEESFSVIPLTDGERVYVADLELDRRTLRRWLRAHQIQHPDRVMAEDFRGKVASFDVLDDNRRREWSSYLAEYNVKILILDPLAALLGAYGYDENDNTGIGRLLAALDVLKADAGITELMVIHHMGHAGERSRGASRLRDWPDAEWRLVRERPDNPKEEPPPDAARFFAAEGRDVAVPETRLDYDHDTRRLSVAGGNRVQHKATKDTPAMLEIITSTPGLNGKELEARGKFKVGISRDRTRAAITALIADGKVYTEQGPNNATLHYPSANRNGGDDG